MIDKCRLIGYTLLVIKTWRHKGLRELFMTGRSRKVNQNLKARAVIMLDVLDQAEKLSDLNVPGFDFHALKIYKPKRYSIHISGPWCITFEFSDSEARRVNLEQYH